MSSSSSSSDQDSLEEDSSDNRSVEISSNESDSGPDKEMVEDRSIELMIFSPAGTTPAQADFPPIPIGDTKRSWEPEPPSNAIQKWQIRLQCISLDIHLVNKNSHISLIK